MNMNLIQPERWYEPFKKYKGKVISLQLPDGTEILNKKLAFIGTNMVGMPVVSFLEKGGFYHLDSIVDLKNVKLIKAQP